MACSSGTFAYTIKAGDTYFLLAQRFGTTVAAIEAANPGVNPNNLQIGQVICIPGGSGQTCPSGTFPYTVQSGDTFFRLAQRFSTTVTAIQAANPGVNPNNIQVGSTLCIPGTAVGGTATTCPTGTFAYTVKAGDTFFLLAQRFNTTVAAIQAANPTVNPLNIQIGSTLCIPGTTPTTCPTGTFPYIVQAGDTFFLLAQRFNTTVAAIQAANPTVNPNNLQIGSTLCIPGAQPGVCPTGTFAHTIVAGDTCFLLAQQFNTTVAAIQAANPGINCNNLIIGSIICIPSTGVCPTGTFPHTIVAGDTCFLLAQQFNTTVAAIQAANPGINCNNLIIGSTICIPSTGVCPTGTFAHTVVAGDTCFSLAAQFNTTVAAIQAANPGINCNNLIIGSTICIPKTPSLCPTGTFAYTIVAGDTCFSIATRFGTTVSAIQAANPGIDCNNLPIGAIICVPNRSCGTGTFPYVVVAGDTCTSIATRFNTTVTAIQNANPGLNCNALVIGETICVPGTPLTCPEGAFVYTIKAGDTCFLIASRYRTTTDAILAVNPGLNCNNLQVGQRICVPCGASS